MIPKHTKPKKKSEKKNPPFPKKFPGGGGGGGFFLRKSCKLYPNSQSVSSKIQKLHNFQNLNLYPPPPQSPRARGGQKNRLAPQLQAKDNHICTLFTNYPIYLPLQNDIIIIELALSTVTTDSSYICLPRHPIELCGRCSVK